MSDIAELERRITIALERIGAGVDAMSAAGADVDSDETQALRDALEAEKTANAQLEERVSAIKEKLETSVQDMEARIETLSSESAKHESEAKKLQQVNTQLRESNDELRESNEKGGGDAHLINKAMQTDLESLKATRKADLAELETIMAELKPMIGEDA